MRSILPYICPWRQNKRMIWCSSLHALPAGCWRKEEIACKAACWTRGYVNSAFVTHTQFRPAPQWPNILRSGLSCYQVPTSLWRRINLTTEHSEDVGAMHFQTVSENQLVHNLTNKLLKRSFWATWREANFNLTSKVEGPKPGTGPSEGRQLSQAICTLLKIAWRKNFQASASIHQFRTTSGHEAQHARLSSSPRLLNETPDITFHFVVILNCPWTTESRRQISLKTQISPPAVTLATCKLILPKSNDNPKWDL
jgi:hypothetical protein